MLARWKKRIEAYPEKFLLAESDRWYRTHYDVDMSGLEDEFNRSFIGALDPAIQKQVAYENAERLLERVGQ